jgi:phospholipase/carboxylesterase
MPAAEARAWWMIDMLALQTAVATQQFDALAAHRPPGLDQARVLLEATLDELERALGVPEGKLVLGGFSQGAMLGTDLALTTDRKLAGLIVMSGTLLDEKHWVAAMTGRRGLPVLISHGKSDPLLPYQLAERLRDRMTAAGLGVEFIAFNGGHGIADSVLTALGHFLARVLT